MPSTIKLYDLTDYDTVNQPICLKSEFIVKLSCVFSLTWTVKSWQWSWSPTQNTPKTGTKSHLMLWGLGPELHTLEMQYSANIMICAENPS